MTKQSRNKRSKLKLRRIDSKSLTYIIALTLLIVFPLTITSNQINLSNIVLIIVLANTMAYTLVGTITLLTRLPKHYSEPTVFQFTGYLLLLAMSTYSYIRIVQELI